MRTIYLKDQPSEAFGSFYNPYYWKVIEQPNGTSTVIHVTNDSIEINDADEFFEEVSFIKNKLCVNKIGSIGWEEISRAEFDSFYTKIVGKINKTLAA